MNCHAIGEQVAQTLSTLPEWKNLEEFVSSFQASWLKLGQALQQQLLLVEESRLPEQDKESEADSLTPDIEKKERIYVGVDGVMTPLNQKQGYKEAKVGVIFWEKHHQKSQGQRGMIRQREYVATLNSRGEFRKKVSQLHEQVVGQQKPETIVIGDGAHWI